MRFLLLITLLACPRSLLANTLKPRDLSHPDNACHFDLPLTPDTWKKLEMDQFIASLDGLDKMNLTTYAGLVGATNFFCGIGLYANAGQLCAPVQGKHWLVLVAIQRWNSLLNSLYQGIAAAITVVRDISAGLISDFIPDTVEDNSIYGWAIATLVISILGVFTAVFAPLLAAKPAMEAVGAYGTATSIAHSAAANFEAARMLKAAGDIVGAYMIQDALDLSILASAATKATAKLPELPVRPNSFSPANIAFTLPGGTGTVQIAHRKRSTGDQDPYTSNSNSSVLHKRGNPPPSTYAYQRYATLDTHLASVQSKLQYYVAFMSVQGVTKPIFNEKGLALVLLNGSMLEKFPTQLEIQAQNEAFAKLTMVHEFFRAQNMFVTINCDLCKAKGPGGAWTQDNFLSYCTPQGQMRNIIRAEGIHVRNAFRNPTLLHTKYGYSTEYLTSKAIDCYNKYTLKKLAIPDPVNVDSDCVFAIPVCDCALEVVHQNRKKGKGTVTACRRAGVLI